MARTPTRNERVTDFEKFLRRGRDRRKINFGIKPVAGIEFDSKIAPKDGAILSGSWYINDPAGASINLNEVVTMDEAATADNHIVTTTKIKRVVKEADDFISTNKQSLIINDDSIYLALGASQDLKIKHDSIDSYIENTTGELILSSPKGVSTELDCNNIDNFTNNQGYGERIKIGTFHNDAGTHQGVVSAGDLVMLWDNKWYKAINSDLTAENQVQDSLVAIALNEDGLVLLRGVARVPSAKMNNFTPNISIGTTVYVSGFAGQYDLDKPTAAGTVTRIIGHLIGTDNADHIIYFNPDANWTDN